MNEKQEENAKPKFLKGEPYAVLLPFKDENNNPIFANLGYTLPFGGLETAFVDVPGISNMLKGMGLAGGIEAMINNFDPFTGKEIYNENDLDSVKRDKMMKYAFRFMSPGIVSHAMNLIDAAKGKPIGWPYPRKEDFTQVGLRALGISTYTGGYNEAILKIRELEKSIDAMQYAARKTWEDVYTGKISRREAEDLVREAQALIKKKQEEIIDIRKNMPEIPKTSLPMTESGIKALQSITGGRGQKESFPGLKMQTDLLKMKSY